jgi:LPS-assembly protein
VVNAGVRYDIENNKPSEYRLGFGYIDDCFMATFQYYTDYTLAGSLTSSQTYLLQISLRTLGGVSF